ncbi:hypothetical protein ACSZNU_21570 [Aeromonas hydrophila]
MSLDTYEMLRAVAAEIRSSSSSGKDALERAHKGAMFLLHEVHESKDIVYGDKATMPTHCASTQIRWIKK